MEDKLSKGWIETEFGNYIYLKNGYAYKTTQFKNYGIPILKISNITRNGKVDISNAQFVDDKDLNPSFIVSKGDIVIAMSGATTGKYGIYESDELLLQNQRVGNIKLHIEDLGNKRFVYYLLGSLKKEIEDKAYGGAQPNISPSLIESIKIPLPPLAEQERIVTKLDTLFAQHEVMKRALERIPKLLKEFREQVLTQAVTGKLTEKWREGKKLGEWEDDIIKNISSKVTDGEHKTPKRIDSGNFKLLSAKNVRNGYVEYQNYDLISEYDFKKCLKRCKAEINDVLIVSVGATIGRAAIVNSTEEFALVRSVALIKPNHNKVLGNYLLYSIQSKNTQSEIQYVSRGSAQNCLYINKIENLKIKYPPIVEQTEIISRVESFFSRADVIESYYKKLKNKIDNLPQAILHKAFKGELVAQLPTDGDAKDLLEEIKALKSASEKIKKCIKLQSY